MAFNKPQAIGLHEQYGACHATKRSLLCLIEKNPMSTSMYSSSVPVFKNVLRNLSHFLDKAKASAEARKFDIAVLLNDRLAPDMLPFIRQVQIACDSAKLCVARLSGV